MANPPKEHQFQKGQSGNPRGRPKGSKNKVKKLREEFHELINTKVSTPDGKSMTRRQLLLLSLIKRASDGNGNALKFIREMLQTQKDAFQLPEFNPISAEDAAKKYTELAKMKWPEDDE